MIDLDLTPEQQKEFNKACALAAEAGKKWRKVVEEFNFSPSVSASLHVYPVLAYTVQSSRINRN